MANTFYEPFDFQPNSRDVKSGSYSVPSSSYAEVTVIDDLTGFTIDGDTVVTQGQYNGSINLNANQVPVTNGNPFMIWGSVYIAGSGSTFDVQVRDNNDTFDRVSPLDGSTNQVATANGTYIWYLWPGDQIKADSSGSGNTMRYNFIPYRVKNTGQKFWVPPGASLNGTSYEVALYTVTS